MDLNFDSAILSISFKICLLYTVEKSNNLLAFFCFINDFSIRLFKALLNSFLFAFTLNLKFSSFGIKSSKSFII